MKLNLTPRTMNAIVGAWLFISAFAWDHSRAEQLSTWIVGALCVAFSLGARSRDWMRYVNTVLAIWLFVATRALPTTSHGTLWNNVMVAIAMFVLSLIPTTPAPLQPHHT